MAVEGSATSQLSRTSGTGDENEATHAGISEALLEFLSTKDEQTDTGVTLFISGDRSSVGKSTVCLGLLTALVRLGVPPDCLAYIKPVTQCEARQPVTDLCERLGIRHESIGPVVFYKGFTRAFLAGETPDAHALLAEARVAVASIGAGKRLTIVDGVGYPAVGSICSVSNADVCAALGAPVLLVGKSGVGDAVDSHNLNAAFFEVHGVRVLGAVFNKLPNEGYYNRQACRQAVGSYFDQYKPNQRAFGFIPVVKSSAKDENKAITTIAPSSAAAAAATTTSSRSSGSNSSSGGSSSSSSNSSSNCSSDNGPKVWKLTAFELDVSSAILASVDLQALLLSVIEHTWPRGGLRDNISDDPCRSRTRVSPPPAPEVDPTALYEPSTAGSRPSSARPGDSSPPPNKRARRPTTNNPPLPTTTTQPRPAAMRALSRAEIERTARSQGAVGG